MLTDAAEAEIRRFIEALEPAFRAIDPEYPANCCVSACCALADYLDLHLDHWAPSDADWVASVLHYQGVFLIRDGDGYHQMGDGEGTVHNWLYLPRHDVIIDPTVGQFVGGPALRILRPGDPLRERYRGGGDIRKGGGAVAA